ncbi:hypothetical protein SAMN05421825_1421 [Epilithonimonas hungarica]|uniref:Uncharacterized protein n=1 Tax=Epilithonimonas hungarica TaxID=454006 RepID=A0A1G7JLL8_9FLAO|nr:hypothetical protein [Epilithonimonas hungarica]SDF25776.1 hypothetical protein SAMN05421825_1421 [Epilithonimonas hungarica]
MEIKYLFTEPKGSVRDTKKNTNRKILKIQMTVKTQTKKS